MLTDAELSRFERDARAACDAYRRAKRCKEVRRASRIVLMIAAIALATLLAIAYAAKANERNAADRAAATYQSIGRLPSSWNSWAAGQLLRG